MKKTSPKPRPPATPAQKWAQKRNFAKFQLAAMRTTTNTMSQDPILTVHERDMLVQLNLKIQLLLNKFAQRNAISKHDNAV
jgi:hypothetical protein